MKKRKKEMNWTTKKVNWIENFFNRKKNCQEWWWWWYIMIEPLLLSSYLVGVSLVYLYIITKYNGFNCHQIFIITIVIRLSLFSLYLWIGWINVIVAHTHTGYTCFIFFLLQFIIHSLCLFFSCQSHVYSLYPNDQQWMKNEMIWSKFHSIHIFIFII